MATLRAHLAMVCWRAVAAAAVLDAPRASSPPLFAAPAAFFGERVRASLQRALPSERVAPADIGRARCMHGTTLHAVGAHVRAFASLPRQAAARTRALTGAPAHTRVHLRCACYVACKRYVHFIGAPCQGCMCRALPVSASAVSPTDEAACARCWGRHSPPTSAEVHKDMCADRLSPYALHVCCRKLAPCAV